MSHNRMLVPSQMRSTVRNYLDAAALVDLSAGGGTVLQTGVGPAMGFTASGAANCLAQVAENLAVGTKDVLAWTNANNGAFWELSGYYAANLLTGASTAPLTSGLAYMGIGIGQYLTATTTTNKPHIGLRFNMNSVDANARNGVWELVINDPTGTNGTPVAVTITGTTTITRATGSWITDNVVVGTAIGDGVSKIPANTTVATVDAGGLIITASQACTNGATTLTPNRKVFICQSAQNAAGEKLWANASGYRLEIIYQPGVSANFYLSGGLAGSITNTSSDITPFTPLTSIKAHARDASFAQYGLNMYCLARNVNDAVLGTFIFPIAETRAAGSFGMI